MANILAQPREQWDIQLQQALAESVQSSQPEIVNLLLSKGAEIDYQIFIAAVSKSDIHVFDQLLRHGLDINSREFGGETALRSA